MVESNKLMAKFLGYEYYLHSDIEKYPGWRKDKISHSHKINLQGKVGKKQYLCRNHKQLAFDTDWNWLMSVVEKIEKTDKIVINGNNCILQYNSAFYVGADIKSLTKIQAVYSACLQFIQNENNN